MDVDIWNNKNGTVSDKKDSSCEEINLKMEVDVESNKDGTVSGKKASALEEIDLKMTVDAKNNKDVENSDNQVNSSGLENKYPNFWQNFKQYIWEYCSKTSVHGLGFLGERRRTILERIWWLISIQIAVCLCIVLTMKTYHKWTTSPAIVTFATTQTPIWEIPFPAVTICPEIKSTKERYNFTDVYLKKINNTELTEAEELEYQYMLLVCLNKFKIRYDWNQSFINDSAIDFLNEVAPNYNSIIPVVMWMGSMESKDFYPILTSNGICYTFNGLDKLELFTDIVTTHEGLFNASGKRPTWSLESGYLSTDEDSSYPDRNYISGVDGGLDMYLELLLKDIDVACGTNTQGFKVMLHNPEEVPYAVDKYFHVPRRHSVTVALKPRMMTTSDDLKDYSPPERQCYFAEEKQLKYFKIYNQANCISECWINIILETCGCVGFYMPKQKSTPICSVGKYKKCVSDLLKYNYKPENLIDIKLSKDTSNSNKKKCECLPSCTSLDFEFELSQTPLDMDDLWNIAFSEDFDFLHSESEYTHVSNLNVFFKEMQFLKHERNELYGQAEFWANCGGLLGLFTGFSFLSVLEIFYYLTLRLACNLFKFGRRHWSGTDKILETMKERDKKKSS